MDCIDPAGHVFRGSDIPIPDEAGLFRCPECERAREKGRNTLLFRGKLTPGTVIEVLCRRCKTLVKFMVGETSKDTSPVAGR